MHRAASVASVLGLTAASLLVAAASPASAVPADCNAGSAPYNVFFDVNNPRDHHDDLAVGSPMEDVGGGPGVGPLANAGTVTLAYGDDAGTFGQLGGRSISMTDLGFGSQVGDRFGASVLVTDLNGDGCGDLLVGAPGRSSGAGVVVVLYGQPQGQFGTTVQVLKQGSNGVSDTAEPGDGFGSSLAVTGDNTPGNPKQLWIGAPGEDIGTAVDAGMAHVFPIADTGPGTTLSTVGITSRRQGTNSLGSTPESGDRFAASLAGSPTTLLIGVPGEDTTTVKDAGMFHAVVKGAATTFTAETTGVPGTSEAGDQLGRTLAVLGSCMPGAEAWAVGVPFEDIGSATNAGNVLLMDRGTATALTLQQGSGALAGAPESGDHFGDALNATGTINRAKPYLAIGDPLEDVGATKDAGLVTTLTTTCSGGPLTAASVTDWTQNSSGVPGAVETGNQFGASLGAAVVLEGLPATGTLHYRLVVAVPNADEVTPDGNLINSGMVMSLPASANGFTATGSSFFGQNSQQGTEFDMPGIGQTDDAFGLALSGSSTR